MLQVDAQTSNHNSDERKRFYKDVKVTMKKHTVQFEILMGDNAKAGTKMFVKQ